MHAHFRYPAAQTASNLRRDWEDREGHAKPELLRWEHKEVIGLADKKPHHTVIFHYEDGSTTSYNGTRKG